MDNGKNFYKVYKRERQNIKVTRITSLIKLYQRHIIQYIFMYIAGWIIIDKHLIPFGTHDTTLSGSKV